VIPGIAGAGLRVIPAGLPGQSVFSGEEKDPSPAAVPALLTLNGGIQTSHLNIIT